MCSAPYGTTKWQDPEGETRGEKGVNPMGEGEELGRETRKIVIIILFVTGHP